MDAPSLFCLYVDARNEVASVHKAKIPLTPGGTLSSDTLSQAAARCSTLGCETYRLVSGGVFHADVPPNEMIRFVTTDFEPKAWTALDLKSQDDIHFPDAAPALADVASVILLFKPRESYGRKTARRSMIANPSARGTRRVRCRKGRKADRCHETT